MLLESLPQIEEEKRVTVHRAVSRINDIANNLLIQYKKSGYHSIKNEPTSSELIALMIDSVISEKRIQFSNKDITFMKEFQDETYGIFSSVNQSEFKRAISNLINNAVEATIGKGLIVVKLVKKLDNLKLSIIDNGCGISSQILSKIMKGQIKTAKSGTGLGLSYAINRFETWECNLEIKSEIEKGTIVEITMPQAKPADWFMPAIRIKQESVIIVLDDDESIHGVWDQRFIQTFSLDDKMEVKHFLNPLELFEWHKTNINSNIIYLMDYELLGYDMNGIDIIEKLGISSNSVLVTSYFEEKTVRERSRNLSLKAIPKNYSLYIPIEVIYTSPDIIFIDDNLVLTNTWKIKGKSVGKKVATFNHINDFVQVMDMYDRLVPIYIDSDLNDKITGEKIICK